jgi:dUTP pyrophosphatase
MSLSPTASQETTVKQLHQKSMSTPPPTTTAASPPHSPLAKRVKTDHPAAIGSITTSNGTMAQDAPASTHAPAAAVSKMDQAPPLLIKKLSEHGRAPTRGSEFAAGYDLYAARDTVILSRGKALVDTDIAIAVPAGTCKFP